MKLSFYGADQCVTGSCHGIEANGKKIWWNRAAAGRDAVNNGEFPFAANSIDYVLVTHAHIDHSGRIPLLIKQGFHGEILTTRLTGELMSIMLLDSAHIQEQDAEWKNRKGLRAGAEYTEPLYTIEDAQRVGEFLKTCEYRQTVNLCEGVTVEFVDAGHLLGSASIKMTITENGVTKSIVFSGDIGNINQPIIRDPTHFHGADYAVMESTYGDRNHDACGATPRSGRRFRRDLDKGGNVIIHSFRGPSRADVFSPGDQGRAYGKSNPTFRSISISPWPRRPPPSSRRPQGYWTKMPSSWCPAAPYVQLSGPGMPETLESPSPEEDRTPGHPLRSGMCDAGQHPPSY